MNSLKERFDINGYYYSIKDIPCRKLLTIKRKNCTLTEPDLIVVMMNPGSSEPTDPSEQEVLTDAKPDNTQTQIVKVMDRCELHFAHILNLSDFQNAKSAAFHEMLNESELSQTAHSIFDKRRTSDLDSLVNKKAKVILAWGVNKKLHPLAMSASGFIQTNFSKDRIFAFTKNAETYQHYHPLRQRKKLQEEWVEHISTQIGAGK